MTCVKGQLESGRICNVFLVFYTQETMWIIMNCHRSYYLQTITTTITIGQAINDTCNYLKQTVDLKTCISKYN